MRIMIWIHAGAPPLLRGPRREEWGGRGVGDKIWSTMNSQNIQENEKDRTPLPEPRFDLWFTMYFNLCTQKLKWFQGPYTHCGINVCRRQTKTTRFTKIRSLKHKSLTLKGWWKTKNSYKDVNIGYVANTFGYITYSIKYSICIYIRRERERDRERERKESREISKEIF